MKEHVSQAACPCCLWFISAAKCGPAPGPPQPGLRKQSPLEGDREPHRVGSSALWSINSSSSVHVGSHRPTSSGLQELMEGLKPQPTCASSRPKPTSCSQAAAAGRSLPRPHSSPRLSSLLSASSVSVNYSSLPLSAVSFPKILVTKSQLRLKILNGNVQE